MNCYVCATKGRATEAVAICPHCGVSMCLEHLVEEAKTAPTVPKYSCSHSSPKEMPVNKFSSAENEVKSSA